MKSKLLHICAMVLVSNDVTFAIDQEKFDGGGVTSSNEQKDVFSQQSLSIVNSEASSLSDILAALKDDIAYLRKNLDVDKSDIATTSGILDAQNIISTQIASLKNSTGLNNDVKALQRAMIAAKTLLIKLSSEDIFAKKIGKKVKDLSKKREILEIDLGIEEAAKESAASDMLKIEKEQQDAQKNIVAIQEVLNRLKATSGFIENMIRTLELSKLNSGNFSKSKARVKDLSMRISLEQERLSKKAERSVIRELSEHANLTAEAIPAIMLSKRLDKAIMSKVSKSDFADFTHRMDRRLSRVEDAVDLLEPSALSTQISENAMEIAEAFAKVHHKAVSLQPSLADQNRKISTLRERLLAVKAWQARSVDLEILHRQEELALAKRVDISSISKIQSRIKLLEANQRYEREDLEKLLAIVSELKRRIEVIQDSKASLKEVLILMKEYKFILRDLKKLRIDVDDNSKSLAAEKKLYDALQKSMLELMEEVRQIRTAYKIHVAIDEDSTWVEKLRRWNEEARLRISLNMADIETHKKEIVRLKEQISVTETEISEKEPLLEAENERNALLKEEHEEKATHLRELEEQVRKLEEDISDTEEEMDRKLQAIATVSALIDGYKKKLRIIGGTLGEDLVEKDFSSFAETLRVKNRIKEISDVDCVGVSVGSTISSDSDLLTYTRMSDGGVLRFAKIGEIELTFSGFGTLTFTDGVTGIEASRSIGSDTATVALNADGVDNNGAITSSDLTTIVIDPANLSAFSTAVSDAFGILCSPAELSFRLTSGLSLAKASLICSTDGAVMEVPEADISRTSAIDVTGNVTYTSAAKVSDPMVAEVAKIKALADFILNDRTTRLSAIGEALHADLISSDYDNFSYDINVTNRVKGAERLEITACETISAETPTTTSDGRLLYTKHITTNPNISDVSASSSAADLSTDPTTTHTSTPIDPSSTVDPTMSSVSTASAPTIVSTSIESGGTISFVGRGSLSIETTGSGTIRFTSGVSGETIYGLSETATITIPSNRLTAQTVTYTFANSYPDSEWLTTNRIFFDTEQILNSSVAVPLTNPTVSTAIYNKTACLVGKVSEVIEDPALTELVFRKNAKISSMHLENSVQRENNEHQESANKKKEISNKLLRIENEHLEEEKVTLPIENARLQEELVILREEKAEAQALLDAANDKLRAVGSAFGLSMDLIDPRQTQLALAQAQSGQTQAQDMPLGPFTVNGDLITDYSHFNIRLNLHNIIPHISKITDCRPINPRDDILEYRKKWIEVYTNGSMENFPTGSTLDITTSGIGTLAFINGITAKAPTDCSNGKIVSVDSKNFASTTVEYTLSQGLTYSKSVLSVPIIAQETNDVASLTKKWNVVFTHQNGTTSSTTTETGGMLTYPYIAGVEITTQGKGTLGFVSGTSETGATYTDTSSRKYKYFTPTNASSFEYSLTPGLLAKQIDYYKYDSTIDCSSLKTTSSDKLVYTKRRKDIYSNGTATSFPSNSVLTVVTSGSGTAAFTTGSSGSFSDNKLTSSSLSGKAAEYTLPQGLTYSYSTLTYPTNTTKTVTVSNNKVSYTKNWDATLTTNGTATTSETSGSLTLPWAGKVVFTTSGSGKLKVGNTEYSPSSNALTRPNVSSFSYTLLDGLTTSNVKYYYYDQDISASEPSVGSLGWTKSTATLSGSTYPTINMTSLTIDKKSDDFNTTSEAITKVYDYYSAQIAKYMILGTASTLTLAPKLVNTNATFCTDAYYWFNRWETLVVNNQAIDNVSFSGSMPSPDRSYRTTKTFVINPPTTSIHVESLSGRSINWNVTISNTLDVPASASFKDIPAYPATVSYTAVANWGLYVYESGKVDGTSFTGTKTGTKTLNSASDTISLDNAIITSATYDAGTYESGGTLTLPLKGSLKLELGGTNGSRALTFSQGASGSYKTSPVTVTTTGTTVKYSLDQGLTFSKATLTYNTTTTAKGLSNKLVLTRNWAVEVIKNGSSNSTYKVTETDGTLSYPQNGGLDITTIGTGTLKFTAGVTGKGDISCSNGTIVKLAPSNVTGTSLTYTLTEGLKVSNIHYYSYAEFANVAVPALGSLTSYESGGSLEYGVASGATIEGLKINVKGGNSSRQLKFTAGINGTSDYKTFPITLAASNMKSSPISWTMDQGLTYSNSVFSIAKQTSQTMGGGNKFSYTKRWDLTNDGSTTTPTETGGTLAYPENGKLAFTGNESGQPTVTSGNGTKIDDSGKNFDVTGTSLTYTLPNTLTAKNWRYYCIKTIDVGAIKPTIGSLDAYESGGFLDFTSPGDFQITTAGSGTMNIDEGVKTKITKTCSNGTIVPVGLENLTSNTIGWSFTKGMTYAKSVLDSIIGMNVISNELDFTKNWNRIMQNDGTNTTMTTTESGGIMSLPEKGMLEMSVVLDNSLAEGNLEFTQGVSTALNKTVSNADAKIVIAAENFTGNEPPYTIRYIFPAGVHSLSMLYYYKGKSSFTTTLGMPDSNSCSNKQMTCSLVKTVVDPEVMAMIATIDELKTSLTSSEAELAAKQETLQTTNDVLKATNKSLVDINADLISKNNELKQQKLELTNKKSTLETEIEILEEAVKDRETKLAGIGGSKGLDIDLLTPEFSKFNYNFKIRNKISDSKTSTTDYVVFPVPSDAKNYEMSLVNISQYPPKTMTCELVRVLETDPEVLALAEKKADILATMGAEAQAQAAIRTAKIEANAKLQAEVDRLTKNNAWLREQIDNVLPQEKQKLQKEIEELRKEIAELEQNQIELTKARTKNIEKSQALDERIKELTEEQYYLPDYTRILEKKMNAIGKFFGRDDLLSADFSKFVYNLKVVHTKTYNISCSDVNFGETKTCETFRYTKASKHEEISLPFYMQRATWKVKGGATISDEKLDSTGYSYDGQYFYLSTLTDVSPHQALFKLGRLLSDGDVKISFRCEGKTFDTVINSLPIKYVPKFKLDNLEEHEEGGSQEISIEGRENNRFSLQYTDGLFNKQLKIYGTVENIPVSTTISAPPYETEIYFSLEQLGLYYNNVGTATYSMEVQTNTQENEEEKPDNLNDKDDKKTAETSLISVTFSTEDKNGKSYLDGSSFTYTNKITTSSDVTLTLDNAKVSKAWWVNEYESGGILEFPQKGIITIQTKGSGMLKFAAGVVDTSLAYDLSLSSTVVIPEDKLDDSLSLTYTFISDDPNNRPKVTNVSIVYDVITQNVKFSDATTRTIKDGTADCLSFAKAD